MRRIIKGPQPTILRENWATWTKELVESLDGEGKASSAVRGRYRHPDVKDAIISETKGKCAYCESPIRHIDHGDIEHIVPKSKVPDKSFSWDNLTLACTSCNQAKGDYYSSDPERSQENIFDPYVDDADDHFLFFRAAIVPRPDSDKGYATEVILDLSRNELLEQRNQRMKFIDAMVMAYHSASDSKKDIVKRDIKRQVKSESPYYYAVRKYLEDLAAKGMAPDLQW